MRSKRDFILYSKICFTVGQIIFFKLSRHEVATKIDISELLSHDDYTEFVILKQELHALDENDMSLSLLWHLFLEVLERHRLAADVVWYDSRFLNCFETFNLYYIPVLYA